MTGLNIEWLFLQIYNFFTKPHDITNIVPLWIKAVIIFVLSLISVFFIAIIVYSVMRLRERSEENRKKFHEAIHSAEIHDESKDHEMWGKVVEHIKSANPSDWRLAIIEADNMLDILTRELRLPGNSLGERLKSVNQDNFKNLDMAWQAHKVRNRIAHEGLSFELSYTEAKRTIESYETVLREFGFI